MNEENTTIMPPEKQIVQDDRDARAEELESAFSYDGYQVVRKELFAHLRDPAIVIRKDSITFNTACITGLEDVVYVHVMLVLNGTIHFGINQLKGSKAETYVRLAENSKWICEEDALLFWYVHRCA